ncbi:hypothetical protein Tsubulata_031905 [Turnera subulata]|uniref:Uncharacterized protein n=1 Tax=Turnera subulata TaxID=218843 RepID=A0A9Q0FSC8_9ROSI|nr:hypothetical protein Tsubulata_031905 [Turnera subulata]
MVLLAHPGTRLPLLGLYPLLFRVLHRLILLHHHLLFITLLLHGLLTHLFWDLHQCSVSYVMLLITLLVTVLNEIMQASMSNTRPFGMLIQELPVT